MCRPLGSRVNQTDSAGTTVALQVSTSDKETVKAADEQFRLQATGSIKSPSQSYPVSLGFAVVRFGNALALVSIGDLKSKPDVNGDAIVKSAAERLAAIA